MSNFMFDPTDDKAFEKKDGGSDDSTLGERIKSLTMKEARIAVDHYIRWQKTGNWPVTGTIMHEIHKEFYEPLGVGLHSGVNSIFELIATRIAILWFHDELGRSDDTDLR